MGLVSPTTQGAIPGRDRTLPVPAHQGTPKSAVYASGKFESELTDLGRGPFPNEHYLGRWNNRLSHFHVWHDLFHCSVLITHFLGQQPPGQDAAPGAKEAVPRCKSIASISFRPQGQKSAPEGKKAGRKGLGNSRGLLARPYPELGKWPPWPRSSRSFSLPVPPANASAHPAGTAAPAPRGSAWGGGEGGVTQSLEWPGPTVPLGF